MPRLSPGRSLLGFVQAATVQPPPVHRRTHPPRWPVARGEWVICPLSRFYPPLSTSSLVVIVRETRGGAVHEIWRRLPMCR